MHHLRKSIISIIVLSSCILFNFAKAESSNFQIKGSARARVEVRNNSDFNKNVSDYTDFTGSRFRLDMSFKQSEKTIVFFQPQFTKIWGQTEFVPNGTSSSTEKETSGVLNDTSLDVHQAYLKYNFNDNFAFTAGRKELNYGDQLLLGGVGWSNQGRSFDLIQFHQKWDLGSLEIMYSTLRDNNVSKAGAGDKSLIGIYSSFQISDEIKEFDIYALRKNDASDMLGNNTTAYGFRFKSPIFDWDYRLEATFEKVKVAGSDEDELQVDVELGYRFFGRHRLSIEYFSASENYDQLFPTGHKWLGYADLFSRKNIKGFRVGFSGKVTDSFKISLDHHQFERTSNNAPSYNFSGAPYGTSGIQSAIANEIDLVLSYLFSEELTFEIGVSQVWPEEYLKDNSGSKQMQFYYFQAGSYF